MIWRVILIWLVGIVLARADYPRLSFVFLRDTELAAKSVSIGCGPVGQVTTYSWNANSLNLTNVNLFSGRSLGFVYYPSNTSGHITNTSSFLESITVEPENRVVTITDYTNGLPRAVDVTATGVPELSVANTWDNLNRLTGTSYQDGTTISNVYTILDLSAQKDRLGYWTYYTHDGLEHLTSVTDARGNITQFTWCDCGALTSISNALGHVTYFNYNNQELMTNADFADGSSLNWQFDLNGRMTREFDGLGRFWAYTYDNQSFVTQVSNSYGQVWGAALDAIGRPVTVTNINDVVFNNNFDLLNRVTNRSWVGGGNEYFVYATNGLIAYTNQDGQWTKFGRDGADRLVSLINAVQTNSFSWTGLDAMATLTDGLNHTTTWNYNQYGWLLGKSNTLAATVITYQEDADGHVTNRWMMGTNTGYQFDPDGNLTEIMYPTANDIFQLDAINELTNMSDASGNTAFTYTSNSLIASETGPWTSNTVSFNYTQGHRTGLSVALPGSAPWTQTYGFDSGWRMTSITSPAGSFGYQYPGGAQTLIAGITLPNGASIANSYDTLGRMTGTALANYWGHTLDGYVYDLDALELRTNVTRYLGLATNNVSIGYDPIGQLASWIGTEIGGALRHNEQLAYAFDAGGNLHTRTNDALVQSFTVDPLNQLTNVSRTGPLTVTGATPVTATNVTVNGVTAQTYGDFTFAGGSNTLNNGVNSFTIVAENPYGVETNSTLSLTLSNSVNLQFDVNGNLISDGMRSFQYDTENELTNVWVTNQWRVGFIYDGLGRKRVEQDYTWSGSAWVKTNEVRFIYDGMLPIQERDTNNNVLVTYTRGLDLSQSLQGAGGIGGLLARTDSTNSYFYHADANGNITALIDRDQNIVARAEYDAFGKFIKLSGSLASVNRYWFSSKEYVPQAGIYYYGRRFYEPNFGRWLNRDPLGEAADFNLYRFAANSPEYWVDTDGQGLWGAAIGAWVGGGAGYIAGGFAGTFALPGGGTIAGAAALGAAGTLAGAAVGNWLGDLFGPSNPSGTAVPTSPPASAPSPVSAPTSCPSKYTPPTPPANPQNPPGPGWQWRGNGPPGSSQGAWYDPATDQSLRPDLNHPPPIEPHWDWTDPDGDQWRIPPGGGTPVAK